MKLAEAASVLGISLEEVTTDSLKQQYRKLMMSWDPDKVISQYFINRLIGVMLILLYRV